MSANRLTMATIQSITGLPLSGYRPRAKERSDVAAEQQAIGVGKLTRPGRHRRSRDTVSHYVEDPCAGWLLQVEVGRRGRQGSCGRSPPIALFAVTRRAVFDEERMRFVTGG